MKKLLLLVPVVLLLGAGCGTTTSMTATKGLTPATNTSQSSTAVKFTDEPYYQSAYEVDPNGLTNLSDLMKQVLSGFTVTAAHNTDGTTTVHLAATKAEYKTQDYTLKSGEKLYFIETTLGDDSNGEDRMYADDTAVVVDANGYVVQ